MFLFIIIIIFYLFSRVREKGGRYTYDAYEVVQITNIMATEHGRLECIHLERALVPTRVDINHLNWQKNITEKSLHQ